MRQFFYALALAMLVAALPTASFAVDGVLEINQSCAATGCFAGDAPGFPVTINRDETASYRLTSNLVNSDPDATIIDIEDDHVTLDLNGFAVSGPTVCTGIGAGLACAPTGAGYGILAIGAVSPSGIVVKNGVVRGAASDGIWLAGHGHRIEGVNVVGNGGIGIDMGQGTLVAGCRVVRNGADGILVWRASVLRGNAVVGNKGQAIGWGDGSVIAGNVVRQNGFPLAGPGLVVDNAVTDNGSATLLLPGGGYARNVFRGNGGTGAQVSGGIEIGPNLCGTNTTCP